MRRLSQITKTIAACILLTGCTPHSIPPVSSSNHPAETMEAAIKSQNDSIRGADDAIHGPDGVIVHIQRARRELPTTRP